MDGQGKMIDDDRRSLISQCSQAVSQIPRNDITEIKSFVAPPQGVKDVLLAAMILLGHTGKDLEYNGIKKRLGDRTLLKQIETFDADSVPPETRKRAMALLSQYNTDQIKKLSMAISTLHSWALAVADY